MGVIDLTGEWELDKPRSQTMYEHMKLMGCDEIAALASEKLHLRMHVVQTPNRISVWQQSQLGLVYRALHIGQDTMETSSQGDRKVWVSLNPNEMMVDTKFKNGRLLDTRTIQQDKATGETLLCTVLQLTMKGHAGACRTTRYFRKISDKPSKDIINTPPEGISTSSGLPMIPITNSDGTAPNGQPKHVMGGAGMYKKTHVGRK
mmetsp:Transcript_5570/g.8652  ORF Transcript_5570/g.8652 Transcript_5570/m.8652 type:complete len:204 (-) Transcript_5570:62-673(-)|eukprot:CAMPEP_0203795290 /NCGR_PEP_ID=MMETSP0100_2-20121128/7127_1 /ASSEMBLY_ACC=CAM_ASM_000210 /TAXON_ID=96639 /ORGANISM=" , Strain NY0313808BC1" /LENGTH=203 /DNA_ID=CAMNT_0050699741 /DNA_START=128 /DNA_END=739 /DNA_ORIENTATION=+